MRENKKIFATILSAMIIFSSFSNLQMTAFASTLSDDVEEEVNEDIINTKEFDYIALNEQVKAEANATIIEALALDDSLDETTNGEIATQEVGTEFPSSVDLSESEYFPAVGNQSFNGNCGYWSNYYTSMTYIYNKTKGIETTLETSHNPIFGYVFYGKSLEDSLVIATQIGYPTIGVLPIDHYGTNTFSPYKEVWEDAIMHRLETWVDYKSYGEEDSVITGPKDASLNQMKQVLCDGGCLGIGTLSAKWNYSTVASGKHKGELVIDRCDGSGYGGHGVSIVGYDDNIWVDINYDGEVQEAEMGAFKVVNSWGDEWGNKGFVWIAYDALNTKSQVLTSSEETRINNAIDAGTLKANKVNNSSRSSFFMGNNFSTPKVREKDTSNCWCYLSVNTGSRKEMKMSVTATDKTTQEAKTYNFPSIIYDSDNYAWDGAQKSTDATMVFDLDNLISDISADTMENYTWEVTFGDTTLDEYSVTVKDVYFTVNGVKKYTTNISKLPLNGTEKTYKMAIGGVEDESITEENKKNITIYYSNSNFDDANIHYKDGSGKWTTVPGVQMNVSDAQDGYTWKYVVNMGSASSITVCFNNRNGTWDNNKSNDYTISKPGCYGIKNGVIAELEEVVEIPAKSIKLDKEDIELYEGEQAVLTATITPTDVTDNTVIWTSSDTSVAAVVNGVVTANLAGTATITATTSNGITATAIVTIKAVSTPLTNDSTISATTITKGTEITMTGSASGGTSPYQYAMLAKHSTDSSWTVLKSYNTTATKKWTPSKTGTYKVAIKVKDSTGEIVEKLFDLTVNAASLTNNSTISATTITKGTEITMTGSASGGTSPYQYAMLAKHSTDSSWTVLKGYNTTATKKWTPAKTGTYKVAIKVKDSAGKIVEKLFNLTVNAASLTNNSTISATNITYGTEITMTGSASGGISPYQYQMVAKHSTDSSWTVLKGYNTTATKKWTPSKTGTYKVAIKVKDSTGKIAEKLFTLTVNAPALTNNSTISATTITKGTEITMTGSATGGTSPYQYQMVAKHSTDSSWTVLKDYSTTATKKWTPAKTGTYKVAIKVKDSTGKSVEKLFILTII